MTFRNQTTQRHTEHLAALLERLFYQPRQQGNIASHIPDTVATHADNGRLHLRRRIEHRGRHSEEILNVVPQTDEYGDDTVALSAGTSGKTLRHLTLYHTGAARNEILELQHFEEYLRGYVIGIVAREDKRLTESVVKMHLEEIILNDIILQGGECTAEILHRFIVKFHNLQRTMLLHEKLRQDPHTRPDFKDRKRGTKIDGVSDATRHAEVG